MVNEEKMTPQKPVLETLCAIQGALGQENQKVFAKASIGLGKTWGASIPTAKNLDELMVKIVNYLQDDFQLGKSVKFVKNGSEYVLQMRGCSICHGKLVKERYGITPACAMSLFPVGTVTENLKIKNAKLKEIRKPGPVGDCELAYEITQ